MAEISFGKFMRRLSAISCSPAQKALDGRLSCDQRLGSNAGSFVTWNTGTFARPRTYTCGTQARRKNECDGGCSPDWLKAKNPACEAVRREAEEDWGQESSMTLSEHQTAGLNLALARFIYAGSNQPSPSI
jgi:hypothetical protein